MTRAPHPVHMDTWWSLDVRLHGAGALTARVAVGPLMSEMGLSRADEIHAVAQGVEQVAGHVADRVLDVVIAGDPELCGHHPDGTDPDLWAYVRAAEGRVDLRLGPAARGSTARTYAHLARLLQRLSTDLRSGRHTPAA